MVIKEYLQSSALSGVTTVTEITQVSSRTVIRLDKTLFHPQGGGQKPDRGKIGDVTVIHVAHNDGHVDHYVDSAIGIEVGQAYEMRIDREWRQRNAVYHTAGHLIACVVETQFPPLKATAGHQWPGEARVEFASMGADVNVEHVKLVAEEILKRDLHMDLIVQVIGDPFANRSIQIGAYCAIPCGGTHISSLREIQDINILGVKRKGDRIRVSFEAFGYEYLG